MGSTIAGAVSYLAMGLCKSRTEDAEDIKACEAAMLEPSIYVAPDFLLSLQGLSDEEIKEKFSGLRESGE